MDYLDKELLLKSYKTANSKNTIDYLSYLLNQFSNQKLLIFWDGAYYHHSKEIQNFLASINPGLTPEQWKIHCIRFAPDCPSQNPIKDIWLQRKLGFDVSVL